MITKRKLLKHIQQFPEEMSMEELIEKLLFIEKLEKRIAESDTGEVISEEELKKNFI
ncbi:hypothetical protein [Algoriphagus yeomjeoni]|nr:hypothetical protein [Algoriphagus yeomjeoni]